LFEWKPHIGTDYDFKIALPLLKEEDVCVSNAMNYTYYDKVRSVWSTKLSPCEEELTQNIKDMIPERSRTLERYLSKPSLAADGLPSNVLIVSISSLGVL
jgi:hypothetical protein